MVVAVVDEDERNEVVIRVAAVMVVLVVLVVIDKASAEDDLDFRIRCFLALLDLPMFVDARSWKDEKGR